MRKSITPGLDAKGMMSAFGWDPAFESSEGTVFRIFGKATLADKATGMPRRMPEHDVPAGAFDVLSGVAGLGVTGVSVIGAFLTEGPMGMFRALASEAAVSKGMLRYGYTQIKNPAGIKEYHMGNFGQSAMRAIPGGSVIAPLAGFAESLGRNTVGHIAAGAVYGAMGGGFIATPFAMLAGYYGTGYAGTLTMGSMAAGAAYAIPKGTYEILKMGNAYTNSRRGVHTDGDMAAFSTQGAYTMRARAVQAIARSHTNNRSALGQEASLMHRNTNYHSRYR